MTRVTTAILPAALAQPHITHVALIELHFDSGTVYLADAPHNVTWASQTWLAAQGIGTIEPVTETDASPQGLRFTLAAVHPAQIASALTEMAAAMDRKVRLRLLVIEPSGTVREDPNVWTGYFDVAELEDGANPVIRITAEHELIAWSQPSGRLFSHEEQQRLYPGDMFFEYAASMAEAQIKWPRKEFFRQ